jgi:hypothetical protein
MYLLSAAVAAVCLALALGVVTALAGGRGPPSLRLMFLVKNDTPRTAPVSPHTRSPSRVRRLVDASDRLSVRRRPLANKTSVLPRRIDASSRFLRLTKSSSATGC